VLQRAVTNKIGGFMSSIVYALLVGIDRYQPPVPPLSGCVADIETMHTFLRERISEENRRIITLKNDEATYAAVADAFLSHLGQAGKDDVALFYYSGHGSQAPTAPEFWHLEPDRLDETLVCYDSRMPGKYDLADKEISKLIAEIAKKEPHIVILLDSCHSGSATRNIESIGVRRVPTDDRQRLPQSYLVTPSELANLGSSRSVTDAKSGWLRLPRGKHIVLSACQSDEEAKEIPFGEQVHGVFSYFFLQALQNTTASWSYRDLFARVNALVRAKVARQSPLIEATDFQDLDRPFLGGAVRPHPAYFTVRHEKELGWTLDGGAIHGIPRPVGEETTYLRVFPAETENFEDASLTIGSARVTKVDPTRCQVEIVFESGNQPEPSMTYKAVVASWPLPALGVRMEGDAKDLELVRAELRRAGPAGGTSLLVRELEEIAELKLIGQSGAYRIMRAGDDRPLYAVIEGGKSEERPAKAVAYLEHIARWIRMANLANPAARLAPDAVRVEVFLVDREGQTKPLDAAAKGSELRLDYDYWDGEWHEPQIKIKLTNNTNRRLYCMLFDLTDRFKVTAALLPGGGIWLDPKPKNEAWAFNGNPISVSLPDELWQQGMTEYKDMIKLIAATEECNATLFEQDNLEVRYDSRSTRGRAIGNTLERMMQRVHTRDMGGPGGKDRLPDWITAEISITTVRPLEAAKLADAGRSVSLAPQVTVVGHPKFRATARLSTAPLASRAMIGTPPISAWLRDDPTTVQPLQLSPSRSVDAPLNVLELTDVSEHEAVTQEQPLIVRVESSLKAEEHVLPIAYDPDSGCYIPIGRARKSQTGLEVRLEHLPKPAADTRSLTGSIKIFFEKVICEKLGFGFRYPLLGFIDQDCKYNADLDTVRERVNAAQRILLYVHGIIGDTKDMATSGYRPKPAARPPLDAVAARYDLVLTFDYENLNTSIQANARLLKQRLQEVGLGAGHGKILDIVAHSMGGLVARWFIEREGGNALVQRLVMLGTPNAGSPWPTVQDWATAAIGLGLNALTTIAWPAKVLGTLVSAVETIDVALDEMKPGSDFLAALEASPDPGIPYIVLAGNTSVIPEAMIQDGIQKSRVERLFASLRLRPALHKIAMLAFFGRPNDVAVGVESISSVPKARAQPALVHEVSCDHMSYFTTEAGLRALANVLR
jgi:pimeloyl-ACP methyl ester carboxylesterase